MNTFEFHSDPSHGWLAVSEFAIRSLGMSPRDFSRYSYQSFSGLVVYLEEDCDAAKFLAAYKAKHGAEPTVVERHSSKPSFIRNLARVQPWKAES